ncbi:CLUMA_CG006991, isoform A [Clunio marinus]|uniref:CLUMA_CG006991, isoform A n=1 Tax=Clunio marinus TaxID=568069 RepID=A0A1J1HZC0_9DIPT|nr:CLUMA_CG006991, isoform A [Clunio marinus]
MSNSTYNNLWKSTQNELEKLATHDFEYQATEPQFDKHLIQMRIFELYAKYVIIGNKLNEIYDQMLQPQKRVLVKKILDACLGRVCELKQDLVKIDLSEFNYNDEIMMKLKLTPFDLEIEIPKYFQREREHELALRNKTMDDILKRIGVIEEDVPIERLTELEAIRIIQMHERARQGRLRAQFMKEIRSLKEKGKPERGKAETGFLAAMKIQKMWRGFASRLQTRKKKLEEMILIGMLPDPKQDTKLQESVELLRKQRYRKQSEYYQLYLESLKRFEVEIKSKQGASMSEDMADEIRNWFRDYFAKTGKLPEYPSEDAGGSRHLLSRQGTESEFSRSSAPSSKESKKTVKEKGKEKGKGDELVMDDNFKKGFKPDESSFLPEIKTGIDEYNEIWRTKDESSNLKQLHYEDMIYAEKYREVEMELRKIVDEMMRNELDLLQIALDKDRAAKGKKVKKGGKKARRTGKKSKKKKEKDLTPDRTTESLFEELVVNGILVKYPEIYMKQYLGDRAYSARSPMNPALGDIRQVIKEYCILPLGSQMIRNYAPCIKSVLIVGPKGTGKRSLVQAVATETGAIMFDLSPANLVGKYPGKTGLIMLMHLVQKVSRLLQPAVLYFEDAEKPFMKKIPKTDRTDPKRLKKDLQKIVKNIAPEDRVILIGVSNAPWDADQKLLQQTYNRFIYIPRPDYGSLSFAWRELLAQYSGVSKTFDSGAMAKVSDGYTIGSVVSCIQDVITCKRMLQLRVKPLTHVELINALSTKEPIYREEEEAFLTWY